MMKKTNTGEPLALHFRRYGDPATRKLLILHGLFGCGANWRTVAARLASSCEVFCLDLRNHGRSPWHNDMEYAAMAGDVARFIADHQLHGAALLGHSMGGKTAMMLAQNAQKHTGALAKLIVVDIAPRAYCPDHHLELMDAMASLDLAATDRRQMDAALATRIPDAATRQFLAQNLTAHADGYRWRLNLAAIRRNMDALAGYENARVATLDTLFIAGADSDYLRPATHREVHARFPNARIETLENAGHWLHAQQPERFVTLCRAFLDQ